MKEIGHILSSVHVGRFAQSSPGTLVQISGGWAYLPAPLPPSGVSLAIVAAVEEARGAIGELAGHARLVQNPDLIAAPFRRREAILSSRIEGTRTEIQTLLLAETLPRDSVEEDSDTFEVLNYLAALEMGDAWIADGRPLNRSLIHGLHGVLLRGVRGQDKYPGVFRNKQVFIGDRGKGFAEATYVPPPPEQVGPLMDDLVRVMDGPPHLSPLLDCALIHYQFEAIHPYEDGNGRLGRLLIPLYLRSKSVLDRPLLYLGPYLEAHRDEYFALLLRVSTHGAWDAWLQFFLRAVAEQARESGDRVRRVRDLHDEYQQRVLAATSSVAARRALDVVFERVFVWASLLEERLDVRAPTARQAIEVLVRTGVLRPSRRGARGRQLWVAQELLDTVYAE